MNLESIHQRNILTAQRHICGWNHDKVSFWRESMARGDQTLFWIAIPASNQSVRGKMAKMDNTEALGLVARPQDQDSIVEHYDEDVIHESSSTEQQNLLAVGHVSLDKVDTPSNELPLDTSLASGDGRVMTISALFVLPAFASFRLGAFAMDTCEEWARQAPYGSTHCEAVTINTLSPRYLTGGLEGLEGMGRWEILGVPMPSRDNSLWYARRGYVKYKEEIRYFQEIPSRERWSWYAIFMRKTYASDRP